MVIRTDATHGRHATIGASTCYGELTNDFVKSGEDSVDYEMLPFMMCDIINDTGLYIGINVVPVGDRGYTTGTRPGKPDLCSLMIPRYLADYCGSADEAIQALSNRDIYAPLVDVNEEVHVLICDKNKSYIVEFVENTMSVIDNDSMPNNMEIMTNFFLDGWNGEIKSKTLGNTDEEIAETGLTNHSMGLERYLILKEKYADQENNIDSLEDMKDTMESVRYFQAYDFTKDPYWYSEFTGYTDTFGDVTIYSDAEAYRGILEYVAQKYEQRKRDSSLWITTHTSVFDIANKQMNIYAQEDYNNPFKFQNIGPDEHYTNEEIHISDKERELINHAVKDVKINGESVVENNIANIINVWEEGSGLNSVQTVGNNNHALAEASTSEGAETDAHAYGSHAEGYMTSTGVAADYSHSEGYKTSTQGPASHAEGDSTVTNNPAEHAEGKYNKSNMGGTEATNTISSIGIGNASGSIPGGERKNAFEVMQNGDMYVYGVGDYNGQNIDTATTIQEVIADKIDSEELDGYATEEWVENKGYLTEHQSLVAYRTAADQDVIDDKMADDIEDIREIAAGKNANHSVSSETYPEFAWTNRFITITGSYVDTDGTTFAVVDLKKGDNIFVIEEGVPDRWVAIAGTTATLYRLDTMKSPVQDVKVNGTSVLSNSVANVTVPTLTSDLTNDSGFVNVSAVMAQISNHNQDETAHNDIRQAIPTKTSDLTNDSGFIVNADITVTPAMVISQDPLKLQLSAEQDAIIQNEANDFIRLDATALGVGSSIFTKTKSNVAGDFILVNAICEYNTSSYLPQRATTNVVIYHSATKVAVYSVIDSITSEKAEHVNNKVTTINEYSDDDQYPSAKAVYTAVEAGGKVKDVEVNNVSVVQDGIANIDITGKQDVISDLNTIRSGATAGSTAVQPATLSSYSLVTETGNKIDLQIDSSTYVLKATLKDKNNNLISTSTEIDLPLETMVVGASYDSSTKEIVLTLKNGNTVRFSVADLVSGLENTYNKVTSISSSSTDTQYPSAKAVYDEIKSAVSSIITYSEDAPSGTDWNIWCKMYIPKYLCFTANQANSAVGLVQKNSTAYLKYSTDKENWTEFNTGNVITLTNAGDKVYFKGSSSAGSSSDYTRFNMSGSIAVSGDIMTILCGDKETTELPHDYCCYKMFYECGNHLISAPELPATTLTKYCYDYMFYKCYGLITPPELPAMILTDCCYDSMFYSCYRMTSAPRLPSTNLAPWCYAEMFSGCNGITTPPELPATTLADGCYYGMLAQTYITRAPELPATVLAKSCYSDMFNYCSHLTAAPSILPATTLAPSCYYQMFAYTDLRVAPELPAETLASYCYYRMFQNCSNMTAMPVLPATTLAEYCYSFMVSNTGVSQLPELPVIDIPEKAYYGMFYSCWNIKLSTTQTGEYQTPYRIPAEGTTQADKYNVAMEMFNDTGGTFKGTPDVNTTYYTSNAVV